MVDNSTGFDQKIIRVIAKVCVGIEKRGAELVNVEDRLKARSRKRKFLIKSLPDVSVSRIHFLPVCMTESL